MTVLYERIPMYADYSDATLDALNHGHRGHLARALARGALRPRMAPSVAGGIAGLVAGPVSLSVARLVAGPTITTPILHAAENRGVSATVSFAIAYATVAAVGALAGGSFAVVTRNLTKLLPLLVWGVVFFVCVAIVVLTAPSAAERYLQAGSVAPELSLPVLLAGAVFGVLVSFSLPIRCRR